MEDNPLPEVPAPAAPSGSWLNRIIAVSALITSVVSIFLGVQNSDSMNRLVEASSWPHLGIASGNLSDVGALEISVAATNEGVGPAKLHSLVVSYDGQPTRNLIALVNACCSPESGPIETIEDYTTYLGAAATGTPSSRVIRAGETALLFRVSREGSNEVTWDLLDQARLSDKMVVDACYCSVFDECWISDLKSLEKQKVASCEADPDSWRG